MKTVSLQINQAEFYVLQFFLNQDINIIDLNRFLADNDFSKSEFNDFISIIQDKLNELVEEF